MIIVSPLPPVPQLVRDYDVGRVIGLLAGPAEHPNLPELGEGNHLKLTMHDIAMPMEGMKMPGQDQVEALIAFIKNWDRKKPMLVHCFAGVSRSTATAFTAQCILNPQTSELELAQALRDLSPTATPNPLIIAHADALLGRNGAMIAAIEEIGRGVDAFEGKIFEWQT